MPKAGQSVGFFRPCKTMALMHSLLVGLYLQDPVLTKKQVRYFEDEIQDQKFFLRPDLDIVDLL